MTVSFPPAPKDTQEIFDRAAKHILAQGKPGGSIHDNGSFSCLYSKGCAIRPFLPEGAGILAEWDEFGAIEDVPDDRLDNWMNEHMQLLACLQVAHDTAARWAYGQSGNKTTFIPRWKERMREIAVNFSLSPAILDEA